MVERGGVLLRRPTEVTRAPPAKRRCGKMRLLGLVGWGDAGASRPRPSPEGCIALWTLIRGEQAGWEARLAEGEPGLRGSRRTAGAPQRGTCEAPPIRHGFRRDTFPSGEGGLVACARAGLPYGRPASRGVARSAIGARGGDLLRRPTEAAHAPPVMGRVRRIEAFPFRLYRQRQTCSQYHKSPKTARGVRGGNAPLALHDCVAAHQSCAGTPQARRARRAPCPHATCMTPHARVA